jgi:hypothetical protein
MRKRWVVLHEVAHSLIDDDLPGHGPEFMRVYIDLLARYCDVPASLSRALATEMRVKVARAATLPSPLPRATIKRLEAIQAEIVALQRESSAIKARLIKLEDEAFRLRRSNKGTNAA